MSRVKVLHEDVGGKMVLSIEVSLSLNHLKTRGIGGSKEGEKERALRASAGQAKSDDPKYKVALQRSHKRPV